MLPFNENCTSNVPTMLRDLNRTFSHVILLTVDLIKKHFIPSVKADVFRENSSSTAELKRNESFRMLK